MREIKFRYYQAPGDGESGFNVVTYTLDELESGTIDRLILCQKKHYRIVGVAQYTGLKDKNGKEIYEGDIVIDSEGDLIDVIWNYQLLHYLSDVVADQLEVIGNVFEHPELLEK